MHWLQDPALSAETWLGILLMVVAELVPSEVKTTVLGIFLFLMNSIGGNIPVLVDSLSKLVGSYRTALTVFFPAFVAISMSTSTIVR